MKKQQSTTKQTVRLLWRHIKKHRRFSYPLFISVPIVVVVMDFIQPYVLSLVLQKISTSNYVPDSLWQSFRPYIIAYFLAVFGSGFVGWRLNIWLLWNLELQVTRDLAQKVFNHLIDLSAGFHANRFAGSLVSQTSKLLGAYIRFFDTTIFNLYTLVIGLIAAMVILTPRVPIYSISLLVLSIGFIIGTVYFSRPVLKANTKEAEMQSKQTGNLADSISNVLAVKSFAAGKFEKERFWETTGRTQAAGRESMIRTMYRESFSSIVTSSFGVIAMLIAVFGAERFKTDIATLFLVVSYTGIIGGRLWEFQHVLRQYNRAFGDASDMVTILALQPDIKDPIHPDESKIVRGGIRFKDVTFTHDENPEPLFKKLSLRINAGEKIGLVGHSGSGKTTLTKLLLRFSDIDSGEILIDGQNITHITQDELRGHIAYVPQEPLLFHRSLAENIAYGNPEASQAEIEGSAKLANAHDFIQQLPKKYDTLVGERGVKLSGGQRQRVAIARAMLKNAPILVLDEATSALDSESEKLIQSALWKLMERRTAIVIAHRLSTIQKMDRIIVLDDGKIVEEGSHAELLRKKGEYAKLWSHQSGGFLEL